MQPCGTCALEPMKYGPHPQLLQTYVRTYGPISLMCSAVEYGMSLWPIPDRCFTPSRIVQYD